jgi:hypothetical protein
LLTGKGSTIGFAGQELLFGTTFDNINSIQGSDTADDRITGMDAAATFTIHSSINDYSVDSNFLAFTEFEYVSGGGLNDLFNFVATNTEILEYLGGAGDDVFALIGNIWFRARSTDRAEQIRSPMPDLRQAAFLSTSQPEQHSDS